MLCSNQLSYVAKWRALFAPRGYVSTLRVRFFYLLFQKVMPSVRRWSACCELITLGVAKRGARPLLAVSRA